MSRPETTKWITVNGPGGEPVEVPNPITVFRSPLAVLEHRVKTLFSAIAHGSDEHRAWLKKAIDDHFNGKPVEPPRA